jgi:hypothetical protein
MKMWIGACAAPGPATSVQLSPRRGFFTETRLMYSGWKSCVRIYYPRRNQMLFLRRYLATDRWRIFRNSLERRLNEYADLMDRGATGRAHSLVAGVWDGLRGVTGEQPGDSAAARHPALWAGGAVAAGALASALRDQTAQARSRDSRCAASCVLRRHV